MVKELNGKNALIIFNLRPQVEKISLINAK